MADTTANPLGTPQPQTAQPGPAELGSTESRPAEPAPQQPPIPLLEEDVSFKKRVAETGRVQVSRVTRSHQQTIDELLHHQDVQVEHHAVGRPIDSMPSIRQEGDVTIVPVVEEVLKIERCLVLREEVHIRRVQRTERYQETVTLRKQEAIVSRVGSEGPTISQDQISQDQDAARTHLEKGI